MGQVKCAKSVQSCDSYIFMKEKSDTFVIIFCYEKKVFQSTSFLFLKPVTGKLTTPDNPSSHLRPQSEHKALPAPLLLP